MAGKAKKKEKTMKNGTAPGENLGKSVNFVEQPMKRYEVIFIPCNILISINIVLYY